MSTENEMNRVESIALINALELKESEEKSRSLVHRRPMQEYGKRGEGSNESAAKEAQSLMGYFVC